MKWNSALLYILILAKNHLSLWSTYSNMENSSWETKKITWRESWNCGLVAMRIIPIVRRSARLIESAKHLPNIASTNILLQTVKEKKNTYNVAAFISMRRCKRKFYLFFIYWLNISSGLYSTFINLILVLWHTVCYYQVFVDKMLNIESFFKLFNFFNFLFFFFHCCETLHILTVITSSRFP